MKFLVCFITVFPLSCLYSLKSSDENGFSGYGSLVYPIRGNIWQKEGTVEIWVRFDADPSQKLEGLDYFYIFNLSFGEKLWGDKGNFGFVWNKCGLCCPGSFTNNYPSMVNHPSNLRKEMVWKKGEWHHVALSWNKKKMSLYCDGKLVNERKSLTGLPYREPGHIIIGRGKSPISVDELVISSIERSPEDIAERMKQAAFEDEYSLLLDHMESLEQNGERSLTDSSYAEVVKGVYGNAIKLCK